MSYRRAWLLVDETNKSLHSPAVASSEGGAAGGGSRLTDTGHTLIRLYREAENVAAEAAAPQIAALTQLIAP